MQIIDFSFIDAISFMMWLIASYGLSKIFKKFNIEGWWAFIPGARIYWLGRCADREEDGKIAMIFEILTYPILLAGQLINYDLQVAKYLALLNIFFGIVCMIYKARICIDLCGDLKVNKNWAWLWVFAEIIPCLVWAYNDKYTPSKTLLRYNGLDPILDDDLLRSLDENVDTADSGLAVKIKDRTVRNSGKTTFINAVTGYEKANAEILLDGMNVYDKYDKMKYSIGFVPQMDLIRSNDTVYRTLYDAALLRLPASTTFTDISNRVNEILEQFGLSSVKGSLVEKLSGGQRKRLSIAMEYISDPYLFVLDEPDSGLDGVIARDLMRRLRAIANQGKIVIVITHTPDRVVDLFDDVIVLAKDSKRTGRLAFYGSIDEAREFFGQNSMEGILRLINQKDEGGEGRSDEFVLKYAERQVDTK